MIRGMLNQIAVIWRNIWTWVGVQQQFHLNVNAMIYNLGATIVLQNIDISFLRNAYFND